MPAYGARTSVYSSCCSAVSTAGLQRREDVGRGERHRLLLARECGFEVRFCLLQRRLLLDVGEAYDRVSGFDVVVDVVKQLRNTSGGLCGHRGFVDGLDGAVVDALERRACHVGDRGLKRHFFGGDSRNRQEHYGRERATNTGLIHHVSSSWGRGRNTARAGSR